MREKIKLGSFCKFSVMRLGGQSKDATTGGCHARLVASLVKEHAGAGDQTRAFLSLPIVRDCDDERARQRAFCLENESK